MKKNEAGPYVPEYRAGEKRKNEPAASSLRTAAAVFTGLGGFSMLLLMDGAEKGAAVLRAVGILFAFLGLRATRDTGPRIHLLAIAAFAILIFVAAVSEIYRRR